MRKIPVILLLALFAMPSIYGQIKIGDNPQAISPTSVLELESNDRVLVITRINTAQMDAIVPNQGAMVYNTDTQCVHYYDGTQWVNLCNSAGLVFTTDPIVNNVSTIVITDQAGTKNFEVAPSSIGTEQIINGGINGIDIQDGSIGPGKLQNQSVTQEKLSENSVGAFALDNDNIGLTDFTNDAGFITGADIVSGDAGNNITVGTDNGAFYDNQAVLDAIGVNTTGIQNHIAADADTNANNEIQTLSLTGNDLSISLGNTVTLPAGGNPTDELITNATLTGTDLIITDPGQTWTIPLASLGGNPTDELTDISFNTTTNILSLTNPATVPGGSVDLSSLAGGGSQDLTNVLTQGNDAGAAQITNLADPTLPQDAATMAYVDANVGGNQDLANVLTQGNDGGASLIKNIADPVDPQDAATMAYVDANVGGNQNLAQVLTTGASAGNQQINDLLDPTLNQDAATKGYVDAAITAGGSLTDGTILIGGTGDVAQQLAVGGDATLANDGTLTIADDAITLNKIHQNGSTDGQIMEWDDTAGEWVVADPTSHTGTPNSIFFAADDGTGGPITTETSPAANDDGGLYWDPTKRFDSGALYVGLKPDSPIDSDGHSKVVIAERLTGGILGELAFPLHIQNENGNNAGGAGVGILFAVEDNATIDAFGKGGLVFERTGGWAVGDFHFLQNTQTNATIPTLAADKAFTITSDKDIQLYRALLASNGAGNAGQVLSSTGVGSAVQWVDAGGSGAVSTDGSTIVGDGSTTDLSVPVGGITSNEILDATIASADLGPDVITTDKIGFGEVGTSDLEDLGVTPGKIEPSATDGEVLLTTGGAVVWGTVPAGAVGTGATIDGDGTVGNELEVANNAITTARILDGEVQTADIADNDVTPDKIEEGATGEVLTTDGAGDVVWAAPTAGAVGTGATIDGDGTVGNELDVADGAITAIKIANGAVSGGPAGHIAANSITQGDIGNNAIGAAEIDSDAVSSDEIDDDSIVNVDISSTAAIAGTKINPDFGGQAIVTTGNIDGNVITAQGNLVTVGGSVFKGAVDLHPDYVFQKYFLGTSELNATYNFSRLEEIEIFVKKNHHLPGIKSAEQVKKDGVWDIGVSNLQNLEKIEELFLHTIEQENKIKALQSENDTLADQLRDMKKDLEEIKALLKKSK
ncbi:MAG: beta strand repeat-containing protein [Aurantibacter sp.]